MSDRERRHAQRAQSAHATFWIVALWWAALLALPLYLIADAAGDTSVEFRGLAQRSMLFFMLPAFLLGIPSGVALLVHLRRLAAEVGLPAADALRQRAGILLLIGSLATLALPVLAFTVI